MGVGRVVEESEVLLDAVAGGFAQLARRHAGEVGQVRIEAPLQQLLHQVTATGLHGDMQRRVALLVAELRRVRIAHVHEEGTDALAVVALHGVEKRLAEQLCDLLRFDKWPQRKAEVDRSFLRLRVRKREKKDQSADRQVAAAVHQILHKTSILAQTGPVKGSATEPVLGVQIHTQLHEQLYNVYNDKGEAHRPTEFVMHAIWRPFMPWRLRNRKHSGLDINFSTSFTSLFMIASKKSCSVT